MGWESGGQGCPPADRTVVWRGPGRGDGMAQSGGEGAGPAGRSAGGGGEGTSEAACRGQQFYVAVADAGDKLASVGDLLTAMEAQPNLSAVVVCRSRDHLDAVSLHLTDTVPRLYVLHSDLPGDQRAAVIESFLAHKLRNTAYEPRVEEKPVFDDRLPRNIDTPEEEGGPAPGGGDGWDGAGAGAGAGAEAALVRDEVLYSPCIMVATEVCLPDLEGGEPALGVPVLINCDAVDLETGRKAYLRRVFSVIGRRAGSLWGKSAEPPPADAPTRWIIINFLAAHEVGVVKKIREFTSQEIKEMPLDIAGLLKSCCNPR